jgi:hypothetical protein
MKTILENMIQERGPLHFDDADELIRFIRVFLGRVFK